MADSDNEARGLAIMLLEKLVPSWPPGLPLSCYPERCPACRGHTILTVGEVNGGRVLECECGWRALELELR